MELGDLGASWERKMESEWLSVCVGCGERVSELVNV